MRKPRILISRCIEFEACRWNEAIISNIFVNFYKDHFDFITVCPESDMGLGIPRKSLRLVRTTNEPDLVQNETGKILTNDMIQFSQNYLKNLDEIDGCILKDRSPSCGPTNVKLYPGIEKTSAISSKESGIFYRELQKNNPSTFVTTEGHLTNLNLREHFLTSIYSKIRFEDVTDLPQLIKFHSNNKYLLMAYSPASLKKLGKITANTEQLSTENIIHNYKTEFLKSFQKPPTIGRLINSFEHCYGYFSDKLTAEEKNHYMMHLKLYKNNQIPLIVISSILKTWALRFNEKYLTEQTLFSPYPENLKDILDSGN